MENAPDNRTNRLLAVPFKIVEWGRKEPDGANEPRVTSVSNIQKGTTKVPISTRTRTFLFIFIYLFIYFFFSRIGLPSQCTPWKRSAKTEVFKNALQRGNFGKRRFRVLLWTSSKTMASEGRIQLISFSVTVVFSASCGRQAKTAKNTLVVFKRKHIRVDGKIRFIYAWYGQRNF